MTEDPVALGLIVGAFLLAGMVKGVIGLGLPSVSLGLLTATIDLTTAMALLIIPSLVTNLWQAISGEQTRTVLLRIWPFLLMATVTVWLGAMALTKLDLSLLTTLLGVLLISYASVSLLGVRIAISQRTERWAGPLAGAINGILTGMTGSFVVPGVMYLQALELTRDNFIQAMGMLFSMSTISLAVALQGNNFLTMELGFLSLLSVMPALAGMVLGRRIRKGLSESRFRKMFYLALLILGGYILLSGIGNTL